MYVCMYIIIYYTYHYIIIFQVMFGVLFSLKEQLGFSSHLRAGSTPSTSTNEKHIVIPLSTSFPRIPLLLGGSSSNNAIGVNVKTAIEHKSQVVRVYLRLCLCLCVSVCVFV